MTVTVSVVVRDMGWKKIVREVRSLDGRGVRVGFNAGMTQSDVIDRAGWNEFGAERLGKPHTPSRPFMRRAADSNHPRIVAQMRRVVMAVTGGQPATAALNGLGIYFQGVIRDTIDSAKRWALPNAPITVRLKGHDRPLIETGEMKNAVNYKVER